MGRGLIKEELRQEKCFYCNELIYHEDDLEFVMAHSGFQLPVHIKCKEKYFTGDD